MSKHKSSKKHKTNKAERLRYWVAELAYLQRQRMKWRGLHAPQMIKCEPERIRKVSFDWSDRPTPTDVINGARQRRDVAYEYGLDAYDANTLRAFTPSAISLLDTQIQEAKNVIERLTKLPDEI